MENHTWRKYSINKDYFKHTSSDMAWVLGIIASDGNLSSHKAWVVTMNDLDCLEQVKSLIGYEGIISEKLGANDTYVIQVHCKEQVTDLQNLGVEFRKSLTLKYPNISSELDSHFIRGYFDGDGWFYSQKTQHSTGFYKGQVGITTGSKEFADSIVKILSNNGMKPSIYERQRGNVTFSNGITSYRNITYIVRMTGLSVSLFYKYIYRDSDDSMRLKRKYDKYSHWFDNYGYAYNNRRLNPTPSKAIRFTEVVYG